MNGEIYEILNKINNENYEAYVVGGYVRDLLLGIISNDIDICTNMPYNKLKTLFPNCEEYEKYGCIKFKNSTNMYSITLYRKETKYYKNKPIEVEFIDELTIDLLRRDFTINALCLNKENEIIDLINGVSDLKMKTIRIIGDIDKKMSEDKTRMLRALKYMSILDFTLENNLKTYIINNKKMISNIPINKIKQELDFIFKNKNYYNFLNFIMTNNLENSLGIKVKKIIKTNNYLDIWRNLELLQDFPFTKDEKKYIFKD